MECPSIIKVALSKRLKKDLIIPKGTIFRDIRPGTTVKYISPGHYDSIFGLTKDTYGSIMYSFDNNIDTKQKRLLNEYFENINSMSKTARPSKIKALYNIMRTRQYLPSLDKIDFVKFPDKNIFVREDIKPITQFPKRNTKSKLLEMLEGSAHEGFHQLGVHKDVISIKELQRLGFKRSIGLPVPGEFVLSPSWRLGKLHVRKLNDLFLIHKDNIAPQNLIDTIKHNAIDVPAGIYAYWLKGIKEIATNSKEIK